MSRASQKIALSFPILLVAAIASTSSVNAGEIKKTVETSSSASVSTTKLDDAINVSRNGLKSPLPPSGKDEDSTVIPVNQLSDPNASISSQDSQLATLTSVSQFSDVRPTDWAFTALQSLVERYGVIAGYPNSSLFRGDKPITRFEFAAALNAALDKVNEITAAGLADKISKDDLATLQKLQDQFASELAALRGRVDSLEAKTAKLESQQFSTTTKLTGSASFIVGGVTSSGLNSSNVNRSSNLIYAYAVNLTLSSSFTGKDLLHVTVSAGNPPNIATLEGGKAGLTNVANFAIDGSTNTTSSGSVGIGRLYYRFPVGDQATIWLSAYGLQPFDFFPVISPLRNGVSTPNTAYGLFNPVIFRPGFTDIGIGAAYRFSDQWQLHAGYFGASGQANKTNNNTGTPTSFSQFGLFGGNSTIAAQLTFKPSDRFGASLNFIHKYWSGIVANDSDNAGTVSFSGPTGTNLAYQPFGETPTIADSFGGQFDWRIFDKVGFGGWFSTTAATRLSTGANATILNAALSLGFFDLFKEGNHGGILVGIPPFVTSSNDPRGADRNTPWIIETFYTHRFDKYISITPDIYVVLNPDQGQPLPIWGFTLRTTFVF